MGKDKSVRLKKNLEDRGETIKRIGDTGDDGHLFLRWGSGKDLAQTPFTGTYNVHTIDVLLVSCKWGSPRGHLRIRGSGNERDLDAMTH